MSSRHSTRRVLDDLNVRVPCKAQVGFRGVKERREVRRRQPSVRGHEPSPRYIDKPRLPFAFALAAAAPSLTLALALLVLRLAPSLCPESQRGAGSRRCTAGQPWCSNSTQDQPTISVLG